MIEMPAPQFVQTNAIRMGYYEAGPKSDAPPVILCHGWPELAFSWRHQIKALSEAGIRVIAPDQRGYGVTDRPDAVEAYDIEHLTGDLVGLLDQLKNRKSDFCRPRLGRFCRLANAAAPPRSRGRRRWRQHAAHRPAHRRTRSSFFGRSSASRCTSCNFKIPGMRWTGYSTAGSSRPLTHS